MRIPLPVQSYAADDGSRLVNAYAEAAPQPATKGPVRTRRSPGVASWASVGNGPGRGLYVMGGVLYAVSGTQVYRVSSGGTATSIGTLPGTDRVAKANNGTQAVLITGTSGYVATASSVAAITDADFRPAAAVDFLDNYLLFVEANSGRFFSSDLANATSYDALDFATAEAAPDNLVSLIVTQRQALLLGTETCELWWNAGVSGFPFQRVGSGVIEIGCAARQGVAKADNTVFWLASDRTVRALRGPTPQKVSHHGVERSLRSYARVDDCQAFTWTVDGHVCVAFRFPSAGACWVYDVSTGEWHERESWTKPVWRISDAVQAYGVTLVQDAETGAVGVLDPGTSTEFGNPIVDVRTFETIYNENRRGFFWSLEIIGESGVGLLSGQGSEPALRLQKSDDDGKTWQEIPSRSIGRIGEYEWRAKWNRLGSARRRKFRTIYSDPTPLTFYDVQAEMDWGDA